MTQIPVEVRTSHREEKNGTHTLIIQMSGIPSLQMAQGISDWLRELVRANSHKIGRFEVPPEIKQ